MNTKKFKTRTEFIKRKNISKEDTWEVAIDLGYSSVKLFSPNIVAAFPSFAIKAHEDEIQFITKAPDEAIIYKDLETDETWLVGELAQSSLSINDTSNSANVLYSRDRYSDPMFKVITRVGLGIACTDNEYGEVGGKKVVIQTGLPEKYLGIDDTLLKEFLSGTHRFALKIGASNWKIFSIQVDPNDIFIMSQPKGTLFSVCVDNNGNLTETKDVLASSCVVFDPGFGTFDMFMIQNGRTVGGETFPDLGMRRVLEETSSLIQENFGVAIPVPAMQPFLSSGIIKKADRRTFKSVEYPFDRLLAKANNSVCNEAIERMINSIGFDNLVQFYKYIIITGGTSAAWEHNIKERFSALNSLKIINGNQNDNLSFIYSNVRGYYLYRHMMLSKNR